MNPLTLAGLLKRTYNTFSMATFDNRLKLQKYIYLLQAYGLNLGYVHGLYLRGPYCTELTKDAFQIEDYPKSEKVEFRDKDAEAKFVKFLKFIKPHKDDIEWLEIAGSLHIYKEIYHSNKKELLVKCVKSKNETFASKEERIIEVYNELVSNGVL